MKKLVDGVQHFQANLFSSQRDLFERLASKQNPEALFITCADSRINPNLITNTDPGDLLILRNAGTIIPSFGAIRGGEAATIELAITALGIKDIIVCGHSHCGAMDILMNPTGKENLVSMNHWLHHAHSTRQVIHDKYPTLSGPDRMMATIEENVLCQIDNLKTHPAVASALARDQLKIHPWVYKIESGEVFAYDPVSGQFLGLSEQLPVDTSKPQKKGTRATRPV